MPEPERLQFRIGINLGDVIVDGSDILGDGVNVASRLEGIAEPGGICIASSVFDQISGKLNLGFQDIDVDLAGQSRTASNLGQILPHDDGSPKMRPRRVDPHLSVIAGSSGGTKCESTSVLTPAACATRPASSTLV